jgi:hypothetical protein
MLRGCAAALVCLLGLAPLHAGADDAPLSREAAQKVAVRFGQALTLSDAAKLKPMLPGEGKVRVRLLRLGPEQGSFGARQVEALLQDFLRQGTVPSFEVVRTEAADESYALVKARARVVDRNGADADVYLHLTFQPEGGRWVLREIRESPP